MIRYIVVSEKFEGWLSYAYDRNTGRLIEFRNCAWKIKEVQQAALCDMLGKCLTNENFKRWANEEGVTYYVDKIDLSFAAWYDLFNRSRDKDKAKAFWEKMGDKYRLYAFWKTESYNRYVRDLNKIKMYPKTFLGNHLNDEFDKVRIEELEEQKR